jgi:hypothetical protein
MKINANNLADEVDLAVDLGAASDVLPWLGTEDYEVGVTGWLLRSDSRA